MSCLRSTGDRHIYRGSGRNDGTVCPELVAEGDRHSLGGEPGGRGGCLRIDDATPPPDVDMVIPSAVPDRAIEVPPAWAAIPSSTGEPVPLAGKLIEQPAPDTTGSYQRPAAVIDLIYRIWMSLEWARTGQMVVILLVAGRTVALVFAGFRLARPCLDRYPCRLVGRRCLQDCRWRWSGGRCAAPSASRRIRATTSVTLTQLLMYKERPVRG
jgi:hypothetical protein